MKKGRSYIDPVERELLYENYYVNVNLEYRIRKPKEVTVGERDRALTAVRDGLQSYLDSLSWEEIMERNMQAELEWKTAELIRQYVPEGMEISFDILLDDFI